MQKIILITGASSGIGKALAGQLAGEGQTLLLAARNMEALENLKTTCTNKGATVHLFRADLSQKSGVDLLAEQVAATVPYLSVLINNAGISQRSQAEETTEQVDRGIMELNFFSPVRLTKLLWPLFIRAKKANIVNISSVTGTFGFPQRSAYAASKHALEGFFESWMLENKHAHIHFTTVAPGRIQTNISMNALKADGSRHEVLDDGQKNGISAERCAKKIINAISRNKRKIYIVEKERILLIAYRFFPSLFVYLVKKLGLK